VVLVRRNDIDRIHAVRPCGRLDVAVSYFDQIATVVAMVVAIF
jgi:hypothetical protein